jgi:hypothetical protein
LLDSVFEWIVDKLKFVGHSAQSRRAYLSLAPRKLAIQVE